VEDSFNKVNVCLQLFFLIRLHGAHLLPISGKMFLPINFDYSDSLDAFAGYYINHSVLEIIIDIPFCFSARQMAIYVGM